MILSLFFIDVIFILLFNIPMYSLSLIFVVYKKNQLIIPMIISTVLDIFMNKISMSLITLVLCILDIKFIKKDNLTKIISLLIFIYFIIHFYLGQLNFLFLFKSLILIIIYFLVIKISFKNIY